ncbi:MAG: L,D-transpeptidase family protein [Chitinophagales bacterium]
MRLLLMFSLVALTGGKILAQPDTFGVYQRQCSRVAEAFAGNDTLIQRKLKAVGVRGAPEIYIRAFKQELLLQVWVKHPSGRFVRYDNFKICAASGRPGPKRRQGDKQVPEGFYRIVVFNPLSKYRLSMGIDYPNSSDSIKSKALNLGGDIYIHGECSSIGCLAMGDRIDELYALAVMAREGGQQEIPVHIFPFRMSEKIFANYVQPKNRNMAFWTNLQQGFLYFEKRRQLPEVSVDNRGGYVFK